MYKLVYCIHFERNTKQSGYEEYNYHTRPTNYETNDTGSL